MGFLIALYTDWKNVYVRAANEAEKAAGKVPLTQFGRMCAKLGILIAASSPQAKGRVERNHGTHQDRLIKKLRRKNIGSYAAANEFLEQSYLPEHNRRYQRTPASQEDFHRPKPGLRRLEEVFCLEQARILSQDWMVRYDNGLFQIQRHSRLHAPAEAKLTVQEWEDGRLEMRYRGQKIAWQEIAALPTRPEPPPQAVTAIYRPPATHPWRRDYREMLTRGTARNGETIWRRKAVEKTQSGKVKNRLCRFAWKSRKPRGIPTHYKRAPL